MNPEYLIAKELFGIDPGRTSGAIAKWNGRIEIWLLEKFESSNDYFDFFRFQKNICQNPVIILENITTYPADASNPGKMFNLEKMKTHYAELRAAIRASEIPFIEVMPRTWMKYLHLYMDHEERNTRKHRFRDIAKDRYSQVKVNSKNADALLILEYARTRLKYDPHYFYTEIKRTKQQNNRIKFM